jgi:hypothetical protein
VAAHDAVGVQRMLMEWYASDTARASVRSQLAPLEELGPARGETAIKTLAAYLDQQGSIIRTAEVLHLHRNAMASRTSCAGALRGDSVAGRPRVADRSSVVRRCRRRRTVVLCGS